MKRKKNNNNNSLIQNQQPKIDKDNDNRTLILGVSNCGKTYLTNYIVLPEPEPNFIITKSLNQYPNIKAQTSDKTQQLESYGNCSVVFDDMLLSKQESNIDLFFKRGRHSNSDFY